MKPMLAEDWIESKVVFPVIGEPKIDGVRGINLTGNFTGRSLEPCKNRYTASFYSHSLFAGLDGEIAAAGETDPALCRLTTSALNTIKGEPFTLWWLFDYVTPDISREPYSKRLELLALRIFYLQRQEESIARRAAHFRIIPWQYCRDMSELKDLHAKHMELGYEGTCFRNPNGGYKYGRSTPKEGGLLRIKDWERETAVVKKINEGMTNLNPAEINALGYTERSSHQENMMPNGMVGSLDCIDEATQKPVRVSVSEVPHAKRIEWFRHPELILEKRIVYKHFPKGRKDKPRFPNFESII